MKTMKYRREALMIFILSFIFIIQVAASGEGVTTEAPKGKTIPAEGVSLLIIKSISGDVRLFSWERPEVSVKAFERTGDVEKFKELDEKEIDIDKVGDRIKIELKRFFIATAGSFVGYEIYAPENVNLDISAIHGFVYVTGNRGKEKISTADGYIYLRDIAGSVSAKTMNGDIHAEIRFDAESSFNTVAGSIYINIVDEFSVPFSVETVSGSISVTIPDGYKADLDASSAVGSVNYDVPYKGWSYEFGDKHSLRGKILGGGPKMKLRTVSGKITINSSGPSEGTVTPPEETKPVISLPEGPELPSLPKEPELPSALPSIETVRTPNPPVIDGRLDDECWREAAKIEDFVLADGFGKPSEPTEAYLLWDDNNLYIGIRCYESKMDSISISNTETDNQDWDNDMVQIFIDPTPEAETNYYHITVNPIATVIDWEIERAEIRRTIGTKLGINWSNGGIFDTDIKKDSWTIEAGMPFSSMNAKPVEGDIWRFNLYRMEQRLKEHTYWAPIYSSPDWPHIPDKFGNLVFAGATSLKQTGESPDKEALAISHIFVDGNDKTSKEEILEALELKPGDQADVDTLSKAKSRLESLGWFKSIGIDLTESDKGADLNVKLAERDIISPYEVQIRGASVFSAEQIADLFNFRTFRTTIEDIDTKCRLMESLYQAKGYNAAKVSNSIISKALVIDIDEGRIDKIEVYGNKKISTKDILKSLDLKIGMVYKKGEIDNAVHTLKSRLPYFQSLNWNLAKSEDKLNSLRIEVVEGGQMDTDIEPKWDFSRVHGFHWGLDAQLENKYAGIRGYTGFMYGFSSEIWDYHFGIEKSWFMEHRSTIGIDIHRITDSNDWEIVSDAEHKIAELILGESWRDFYQREGYELNFQQELTPSTRFSVKYRDDEYESLPKTNNWSWLNRSYADDGWDDEIRIAEGRGRIRRNIDDKYKPENPPIDEGEMRSLIAEYTIDTRNFKKDPSNGWFNTFSAEYAGQRLDGEYDFNIYQVNIRRYNRLSGNQFLAFRIKAATTDRELSPLHPRKLYLGGIGTLRGYGYKEFSGDKMVLLNAEYWIMTKWPPGVGMVFFVDSGYAWPYESDVEAEDMKTDVGLGFQLGGLRLDFASPVKDRGEEAKFAFSARLARMF